ncbi:MAG: hypothetical protein AAFT19_11595, partial [Pseudomonadota bacterium]
GLERLTLEPGESADAVFRIPRAALHYAMAEIDGTVHRVWDPGEFVFRTGLDSRATQAVTAYWDA